MRWNGKFNIQGMWYDEVDVKAYRTGTKDITIIVIYFFAKYYFLSVLQTVKLLTNCNSLGNDFLLIIIIRLLFFFLCVLLDRMRIEYGIIFQI